MPNAKEQIDVRELEPLLFFRGVPVESIQGVLEDCPVREIKRGEVLIHAGQPNHFLYVLLSGHLRIHLKLTLDPIAVLGPGEVVGELSVIDGHPTSAYVVAADDCRLLVIDERMMWSLVDSSHGVARNLLFTLARRLRHGNSLVLTSQQLEREYERFAVLDAVTGAYNRRWLEAMMPRQMERSKKAGWPLSSLLIDIDHFKKYNDEHGHLAGDRALYSVGRALRDNMRPGEMVARYGGDEMVALLPDVDVHNSRQIADGVRQAVADTQILTRDQKALAPVTISVGVVLMLPEDTPESLIEAADVALYYAKVKGGNRVYVGRAGTSGPS